MQSITKNEVCQVFSNKHSQTTEGVSQIDGFPVGETSRSRCPGRRDLPVSIFTVARGGVLGPTDLKRKERRFFVRSAGPLGCHTRMRAGFPRDYWIARLAWRGTGPRPTVRWAVPATVARGPVPRDVEPFMKHPEKLLENIFGNMIK